MKRISKKADSFSVPLKILAGIIFLFLVYLAIYNIVFNGLFFGKNVADTLVTCGNPTPDQLYETKCYSQEQIHACGDIGWELYIEVGKAKGCLEDEMCCKRMVSGAFN